MTPRLLVFMALPLAFACTGADAQTSRTPWGDPDLQGSWSNATLTPLQRPADLKDKEFFTPEEAKVYVRQRLVAGDGHERPRRENKGGQRGADHHTGTDHGNGIRPP